MDTSVESANDRPARTPTRIFLETVIKGDEFNQALAELTQDTKRRLVAMSQDQTFMGKLRFALAGHTKSEVIQFLVERVHGLTVRHATLLVDEAANQGA